MSVKAIATVVVTFISYLNFALIYGLITNNKPKIKWFHLLFVLGITLVNTYALALLPVGFKTVYNLLCFIMTVKLTYKIRIWDCLYYVLVIWATGIILDMLFMVLFAIILNKLIILLPSLGMAIISLALQILLYCVFKIKRICNLITGLKKKIDLVDNIVWLFIISIILIVLFSVLAFVNISKINNMLMITLISLIVITLIIFFTKNISDKKVYRLTIDNLLKNNKYYLELNGKNSAFKHNIIHRLNGLKSVSSKKDKILIDDIINEYSLSDETIADIESLPTGINGLICSYIYVKDYQKMNLLINNYIKSELFDILKPHSYNKLCEALGVCLDNAVSATLKSKEKILQIVVFEDENSVIVKIINTFSNCLEIDKLGTANYTTKEKGHGIGLNSIMKRRDIKVKTSIINNLFENQITVKKKKNK